MAILPIIPILSKKIIEPSQSVYSRLWSKAQNAHKSNCKRLKTNKYIDTELLGTRDFFMILQAYNRGGELYCYYCGELCTSDMEFDHKIPLSRDGQNNISNIVIACRNCNQQKFIMTDTEFLRGTLPMCDKRLYLHECM